TMDGHRLARLLAEHRIANLLGICTRWELYTSRKWRSSLDVFRTGDDSGRQLDPSDHEEQPNPQAIAGIRGPRGESDRLFRGMRPRFGERRIISLERGASERQQPACVGGRACRVADFVEQVRGPVVVRMRLQLVPRPLFAVEHLPDCCGIGLHSYGFLVLEAPSFDVVSSPVASFMSCIW